MATIRDILDALKIEANKPPFSRVLPTSGLKMTYAARETTEDQ